MIELNNELQDISWNQVGSLRSWYKTYLEDYNAGTIVSSESAGITTCAVEKKPTPLAAQVAYIPTADFYPCLEAWLLTDKGRNEKKNIAFKTKNDISSGIQGWRQYTTPNGIQDNAIDGPIYLEDLREVTDKYEFAEIYNASAALLDFEQYIVLI